MLLARSGGFTLVEVIVVLVILAILAAIAIPALTGYIDKASYSGYKAEARNMAIAAQTIISESWGNRTVSSPGIYVAKNYNGADMYAVNYNDTKVSDMGANGLGLVIFTQGGSSLNKTTGEYVPPTEESGAKEFAELTAGSTSGESRDEKDKLYFVNDSGAIKAWIYHVPSTLSGTWTTFYDYMVTYDMDISPGNTVSQGIYDPGAGLAVWKCSRPSLDSHPTTTYFAKVG
jgi:type IV pilus assembly protein PilA